MRSQGGHSLGAGFSWQAPYYGWVLAVTLGLTTIISYGTTEYLLGVLVVPIGRELSWDRASLSGACALMLVLAGLLGVPIGRLGDRRGVRLAMATGFTLGGLSLVGLASIQTLWQFYLLWAGSLGVATALTYYPVTFTVVTNWFARPPPAAGRLADAGRDPLGAAHRLAVERAARRDRCLDHGLRPLSRLGSRRVLCAVVGGGSAGV